jgi:hypothetical protein
MALVGLLMLAAASTTGCYAGMNADRQTFAGHIDPSISVERMRAFDQQPWAFALRRNTLSTAWRGLFGLEGNAAYWRRAIAAAERIPEAKPVRESVPADVLDRLDAASQLVARTE